MPSKVFELVADTVQFPRPMRRSRLQRRRPKFTVLVHSSSKSVRSPILKYHYQQATTTIPRHSVAIRKEPASTRTSLQKSLQTNTRSKSAGKYLEAEKP